MPLRIHSDARNLAEVNIRREFQRVRDRVIGDRGYGLLGR
jgi:hypothetical protein